MIQENLINVEVCPEKTKDLIACMLWLPELLQTWQGSQPIQFPCIFPDPVMCLL